MASKKIILAALLACVGAVAPAAMALPFNDDLVGTQPKTGQIMRPEPKDSVPMGSDERMTAIEGASAMIDSPVPASALSLQRGERLYRAQCQQCHGIIGGDSKYHPGTVKPFLLKHNGVVDPDGNWLNLATFIMSVKPAGHYFTAVHYGFAGRMPAYGYKFSIDEHWDIVNFIRTMQKQFNAAQTGK